MDNTLISTVILGISGILVTGYYSWHTKTLAHELMMKQLFTEFNTRYSALNQHLSEIEKHFPTEPELNTAENGDFLKGKVIDFFILCSEEFYWYYHKKRIDKLMWSSWQSGMNYWYNNVPSIKSLWENEVNNNGKISYYITDEVEFFYNH